MTLAVLCVSGWAGSSDIASRTKCLSTLQRPKEGWTVYSFVCLSHSVCLSDICALLHNCQDSRRAQVYVYPIFIVEWTAEWTAISCLQDKGAPSKQPYCMILLLCCDLAFQDLLRDKFRSLNSNK